MSVRVQFVVSSAEYDQLKERASQKGMGISKYVKDLVFPGGECFEDIWAEFCDKLSSFPAGIEFDASTIMTRSRWDAFDRSIKLSIAHLFNKKVKSKEIDNVMIVGRSSANVSIYKKL